MSILDHLAPVYPQLELSLLARYLVDDCNPACDIKVVLLCESPHTDEIQPDPRRPLIGKSGRAVTEVLGELVLEGAAETGAIGDLVCERTDDFRWLGLMNACQLPMQKSVYSPSLQVSHSALLDDLESLHRWEGVRSVASGLINAIAHDLRCRWHHFFSRRDPLPLLVPCGQVARKLRARANLPDGDLPDTPHPSRNQWTRALELYRTMERIRDVLNPQQPVSAAQRGVTTARRSADRRPESSV